MSPTAKNVAFDGLVSTTGLVFAGTVFVDAPPHPQDDADARISSPNIPKRKVDRFIIQSRYVHRISIVRADYQPIMARHLRQGNCGRVLF